MTRKGGLRNGAETERLRGQHKIADISAAIDCTIDPQRFVRVDDGDVRGAEEVVVLQRLLAIGGLVAKRVVELEAALAASLEIHPEIFARRRKIMVVACARSGLGVDQFSEAFLGFAASDQHLPRLAVAP